MLSKAVSKKVKQQGILQRRMIAEVAQVTGALPQSEGKCSFPAAEPKGLQGRFAFGGSNDLVPPAARME